MLRLTPSEVVILDLLARREMVSTASMITALYATLPGDLPDDPDGVIKVLICRLRKKLAGDGIEIKTVQHRRWTGATIYAVPTREMRRSVTDLVAPRLAA